MNALSLTHVALFVIDLDKSIAFYRRYAAMDVVHQRAEAGGGRIAWLKTGEDPFVLVLVSVSRRSWRRAISMRLTHLFPPGFHIGIACPSRQDVDRLCRLAKSEGCLRRPAREAGPIAGYYGILADPDGYDVELSFGQDMGTPIEGDLEQREEPA